MRVGGRRLLNALGRSNLLRQLNVYSRIGDQRRAFNDLFSRRLAFKIRHVLLGCLDLLVEVLVEVVEHVRVGQLLGQNRRDAQRQMKPDAFVAQVVQGLQQGDIGFAGGFVNPFFAVRPASGQSGIGKMAVQHERECAGRGHGGVLLVSLFCWRDCSDSQGYGATVMERIDLA